MRRRSFLIATTSLPVANLFAADRSFLSRYQGRKLLDAGLIIKLPKIAESGNSVPITVSVDSAMTIDEYVKTLHILAPGNPEERVVSYSFTPMSGKAEISTRIKLARTQIVRAVAEMSDGRLLAAGVSILVTAGACIEEIWID